jgi:hypothetical protein
MTDDRWDWTTASPQYDGTYDPFIRRWTGSILIIFVIISMIMTGQQWWQVLTTVGILIAFWLVMIRR